MGKKKYTTIKVTLEISQEIKNLRLYPKEPKNDVVARALKNLKIRRVL